MRKPRSAPAGLQGGARNRDAGSTRHQRGAFRQRGLIGSASAVAGTLGLLPEGLSQTDVLTVVLAITGIGGVVFRKTAKARIG